MNPSSSPIRPRYTQETNFEQAIHADIAQLWQSRQEGYLAMRDKKKLYWAALTSEHHNKAVVVVNGRIECAIKYQELFYDLYQQGFDVYSYDHRGQGLSDRLIDDTEMGFVQEFDDYVLDLDSMVTHFNLERYNERFILGHSMGGNVVTRYLQTQGIENKEAFFHAAALSAPMFGVNIAPYLKPFAPMIGQFLTAVYPTPRFAPGQVAYYPKPFEGNFLSQSEARYQWFRHLYDEMPQLRIGGASTRWVWQSLMACKQCLLMTRHLKTPLLILQAGDDQIVANDAQTQLARKLIKTNPRSKLVTIDGARHELLFERDEYRNRTLDEILAFFDQHGSV